MSQARRDLEKRARNAILQEAFFRWESALDLAGMLILAVLIPAYWWVFLLVGVVIELFIGIRTMRNPDINAKAVARIFEKEFQPKVVKSRELQAKMAQALEYLQQVETAVLESKDGPMRDRLKRTTEGMVDWVEGVYRLAARLDNYRQDQVITQDLKGVPEAIKSLRRRLAEADDPNLKQQIEETIRDREAQYASLKKLENTMENASLMLERNLSDMGRIYSQVVMMGSLNESAGKGADLQEAISEHVDQLQDQLEAMDEFHRERRDYRREVIGQTSS